MNLWIVFVALALICSAQVWGKPTDKNIDDGDYVEDAGEQDDNEENYDDSDGDQVPQGPVQLLTKPKVILAAPGDDVFLPCHFVNADKIVISWMREKEPLFAGLTKLSTDPRIEHLANNTLLIRNVNETDSSDNYMCEALEPLEVRKKVVHKLHVQQRPAISSNGDLIQVRVTPNHEIDVDTGARLTLGCETSGGPPKSLHWARQGLRVMANRETPDGVYLEIYNATRHVAGDYQCVVETGASSPIIKHLSLKVKHVPVVEYEKLEIDEKKTRDITGYYTGLGATTHVICIVHSHPPAHKIQWFKNGNLIKIKEDPRLSKNHYNHTIHVLTIKNTTKSDLGEYMCKATNDLGTGTGPIIQVSDSPNQPIFVNGEPDDDSIVFQWRVVSYKPIVEAELLYRKEGTTEWHKSQDVKVVSSIGKEHIIQTRISGIEAGKYEAMLRTRNDEEHKDDDKQFEWGPYSEVKKFDGEYKEDGEAESVRGSAMRPTVNLLTLLLIISPLAYSCL